MNKVIYGFLLSQVFGVFMFIMAVIVMSRLEFYRRLILQLKADNPVIILAAIGGLLLGIFLVLTHNIWVFKMVVWITVFSWTIFLTSIAWLMKTEYMLHLSKRICAGVGYYWLVVFFLVLGIALVARGIQIYVTHFKAVLQ